MESIRSFIAIELPPEVQASLGRTQSRLRTDARAPVKWVDPAIMHLTLKFLGNVNAGDIGNLTSALEEACRGVAPFQLQISGLGVFPSPRRVQVVWVGLSGDVEKLGTLQKRIDAKLAPLGFKAESRAFTPHLTLARVREEARPEERQHLGELVAGTAAEHTDSFTVDAVHLMKSQLMRSGPIYSRLASIMLK
jgi:2'-5' RNA ligase